MKKIKKISKNLNNDIKQKVLKIFKQITTICYEKLLDKKYKNNQLHIPIDYIYYYSIK